MYVIVHSPGLGSNANSDQAGTLAEWEATSMELDNLEENNTWKKEFSSPDYDPNELLAQLKQLEESRICNDVERMLHLIRTSLSRNTARMGNLKLYQYSHLGTKELVERYIQTALDTISALVEASDNLSAHGVSMKTINTDLLAARQSFGRSALLLSGGGTFGMNHIGVLKALWEVKLLPRIISGASAGSIVSAVMCTTTDEEVPGVLEDFCKGDLAVFQAPNEEDSWLKKLARVLTVGSMFDVVHLKRVLQGLMGNLTFLEAYNRTRRILNICVSSSSIYELPKLLNYVTSPHVVIWSAVAASCSVPLVFSPASLLIKDPKTQELGHWSGNLTPQKWIDGSVENDIPMQRLSEMFNVNHFIVSQVNPHVVPFLTKEKDINLGDQDRPSNFTPGPSWLQGLSSFAKSEAIHRMTTLAEAGFMPNVLTKTASVLSQTYSGDITILPEISYIDFPKVLSNPTPEFIMRAMRRGELATWPKLSRIRNHCAIELALDNAANEVRARSVFSRTQRTARRQIFKRSQSDDGAFGRLQMVPKRDSSETGSVESAPTTGVHDVYVKDGTTTIEASFHQKANSTQIADLLANVSLSAHLRAHQVDGSQSPRPEDISSSGPGLTSDASGAEDDDDDDTSLLSGEETCSTDVATSPPREQEATKLKAVPQSTSLPTTPAMDHRRSSFLLHITPASGERPDPLYTENRNPSSSVKPKPKSRSGSVSSGTSKRRFSLAFLR